jgi:hypothetical protein
MKFVLSHRHRPNQCGVAYAAWKAFDSPLRHEPTLATCASDPDLGAEDHLLLWTVDAESEEGALALLPQWLAERAQVRRVGQVTIP